VAQSQAYTDGAHWLRLVPLHATMQNGFRSSRLRARHDQIGGSLVDGRSNTPHVLGMFSERGIKKHEHWWTCCLTPGGMKVLFQALAPHDMKGVIV
jgi:hypothetical protein